MRILHYCCILFLLGIVNIPYAHSQPKLNTSKKQMAPRRNILKPDSAYQLNQATKAYCQAISEYLKVVYEKGSPTPDTLFIGKNVDMPDIVLPVVINGINTVLLTSEEAEKKLTYRKSLVYLNVVGWIEREKSEFIIVTFYEFKPQHNCSIHYKYNSKSKEMELVSLNFQYPYGQKKGIQKK